MSQVVKYRRGIGVREWSEKHNLHHELLPFDHRKINPPEVAQQLRHSFDRWPVTKQTWTHADVPPNPNALGATKPEGASIPEFLGCYTIDKDSCERYTNPNYCHQIPHKPDRNNDRIEFLKHLAHLGLFSLRDIADMCNVTNQTLNKFIQRRGYSWKQLRTNGQTRFARTMEAIHQWQDIPFSVLCRTFGIARTTLVYWRDRIEQPIPEKPDFKR